MAEFYEDWLWLFCYRNKVLWAYSETLPYRLKLKPSRQEDFFLTFESSPEQTSSPIINLPKLDNLSEHGFKELKQILHDNYPILAKHEIYLGFMEVQLQTIKTNLYNYETRLKSIIAKSGEATDLSLLNTFGETVVQKYQGQIEQDLASLRPGLRVRAVLIETIRGIVEAEREGRIEIRDRNFQNWVAIVGVGVGTASTTASAISPFVEKILQSSSAETPPTTPPPVDPWSSFWFAFAVSLGAGILSSLLTAWLTIWRSRQNT